MTSRSEDDGHGKAGGRIVLMVCDPTCLYAYWDAPTGNAFADGPGNDLQLVLRVHDVSDPTDEQLREFVDFDCEGRARDGVISDVIAGRQYAAELGYHDADERWQALARSNDVETPPGGPSQWEADHFATVPWDQDLAACVPAAKLSNPEPEPIDPPADWIRVPAPATTAATGLPQAGESDPTQLGAAESPAGANLRAADPMDHPPAIAEPESVESARSPNIAHAAPPSPDAEGDPREQPPRREASALGQLAKASTKGGREPGYAPRTREPSSGAPAPPPELQRIYLPPAVLSGVGDQDEAPPQPPRPIGETRLEDADADAAVGADDDLTGVLGPMPTAAETTQTSTEAAATSSQTPARSRQTRGQPTIASPQRSLQPLPFRGESVDGGPPSSAELTADSMEQPSGSGGEQATNSSSSSEQLHVPMAS